MRHGTQDRSAHRVPFRQPHVLPPAGIELDPLPQGDQMRPERGQQPAVGSIQHPTVQGQHQPRLDFFRVVRGFRCQRRVFTGSGLKPPSGLLRTA